MSSSWSTLAQQCVHAQEQRVKARSAATSADGDATTTATTTTTIDGVLVQTWKTQLAACVSVEGAQSVISSLTDADKKAILVYATNALQSKSWQPEHIAVWLNIAKLITRTRSGLQPLYHDQFVYYLVDLWDDNSLPAEAHLEAVRVLANLVVIDRSAVHKVFSGAPKLATVLVRFAQRDCGPEATFLACRVMHFLSANAQLSALLVQHDVCRTVAKLFHVHSDPSLIDHNDSTAAVEHRKIASECSRIVCSVEASHPSLHAKISKDEFALFGQRTAEVLAMRVTVPPEVANKSAPANPEEQQQTALAAQFLADEPQSSDPSNITLSVLKQDVANMLIYVEPVWTEVVRNMSAVHGLVMLFHRALLLCKVDRKLENDLLTPTMSALLSVARANVDARHHVKACLFLHHAFSTEVTRIPSASGTPNTSVPHNMLPVGALSEKVWDADAKSLKSLVLPLLTSLKVNVKKLSGELLFELAEKSGDELTRLVGFGNAAGVLRDKSLLIG